jgi:2'-5' RNA ligase
MAETAFIVRVPEAEALVGELRRRFDPSALRGVPAHITVLVPFMPPQQLTDPVLSDISEILGAHRPFGFRLTRIGRFPVTVYLSPEPEDPFVQLTHSLVARFPAYPPYGGVHAGVVPHLTVAQGDASAADVVERELSQALESNGPVASTCHSVALLENSSGDWRQLHVFALGQA